MDETRTHNEQKIQMCTLLGITATHTHTHTRYTSILVVCFCGGAQNDDHHFHIINFNFNTVKHNRYIRLICNIICSNLLKSKHQHSNNTYINTYTPIDLSCLTFMLAGKIAFILIP